MRYTNPWACFSPPSSAVRIHCAAVPLSLIWSVAILASSSHPDATFSLAWENRWEKWCSSKISNSDPFLRSSHLSHPQCAGTEEGTTWWPLQATDPILPPEEIKSNHNFVYGVKSSKICRIKRQRLLKTSRSWLQQPYQSIIFFFSPHQWQRTGETGFLWDEWLSFVCFFWASI